MKKLEEGSWCEASGKIREAIIELYGQMFPGDAWSQSAVSIDYKNLMWIRGSLKQGTRIPENAAALKLHPGEFYDRLVNSGEVHIGEWRVRSCVGAVEVGCTTVSLEEISRMRSLALSKPWEKGTGLPQLKVGDFCDADPAMSAAIRSAVVGRGLGAPSEGRDRFYWDGLCVSAAPITAPISGTRMTPGAFYDAVVAHDQPVLGWIKSYKVVLGSETSVTGAVVTVDLATIERVFDQVSL